VRVPLPPCAMPRLRSRRAARRHRLVLRVPLGGLWSRLYAVLTGDAGAYSAEDLERESSTPLPSPFESEKPNGRS